MTLRRSSPESSGSTPPAVLPDRRALVLSVLLVMLLVLLAGGGAVIVLTDPSFTQGVTLLRAAETIEEEYGDTISTEHLVASAREGMLSLLDRYSGYVPDRRFDMLREEWTGAYGGIGVTIIRHDLGLEVMSVREDGPAGRAGMQTGEIIIAADTVALAGLSMFESSRLLRGEEGTPVTVQVLRPSTGDTVTFDLIRARLPLIHVPFAGYTPDSAVYVRVLDFEAGATDQIEAAIDSLALAPGVRPPGVILDLRGNPGGLLNEGFRTAALFLGKGTFVVGTDSRHRWKEQRFEAPGSDRTGGLPLALLVDRGSASAAEIVAGALQQTGRAFLVGDTTFGKGLVQGFVRFPDGDGLRLTISRFYFENSVYLNDFDSTLTDTGHGLVPDYRLDFPGDDEVIHSLEMADLPRRFVLEHFRELDTLDLESLQQTNLVSTFIDSFVPASDYVYQSLRSDILERMWTWAEADTAMASTRRVLSESLARSRRFDAEALDEYRDYLGLRLLQLAREREDGTARAYAEVIVRYRPDIRLAETLLRDRTTPTDVVP